MKEEKIKVLALLPMELPKEIDLDNTLEAMQKFVGGLIECSSMSVVDLRPTGIRKLRIMITSPMKPRREARVVRSTLFRQKN